MSRDNESLGDVSETCEHHTSMKRRAAKSNYGNCCIILHNVILNVCE